MFQEVTLVDYRPGEASFITVRARPVGCAYTWRSETNSGAFGFFLLFEGEDGKWYVQEIKYFPDFRSFFAIYFTFVSFEDVKCTFPREVKYITEGGVNAQATFYPEPRAADRA